MVNERKRIIEVFSDVGKYILQAGQPKGYEIVNLHDVHGFYNLGDNLALHIQGYPGMSRDDAMFVSMRLRDYEKMMRIRAEGRVSIGNEHEANHPDLFNWNSGMYMSYDPLQILGKITEEGNKFLRGVM